jgi:hypothetical protein
MSHFWDAVWPFGHKSEVKLDHAHSPFGHFSNGSSRMRLKVGCMGHFAMSTLVLKTAMSPIREYRQVANSPIR